MSIEVTPDALAETVAGFEFAYLLTLGDAPRPHAVAVRPTVVDGVVHVTGLGRSSRRNVEGNGAVTLLWPPRDPDGYTLIVDGDADRSGDDLVVTPGRAVLHRSAPAPQPPVDDGACAADCVELPVPSASLTREAAQTIVDGVVAAFSAQDLPAILDGFTDDAEVWFGPLDPLRGRDAIEAFLRARFLRQTNYRLAKELRMVDGDRMAVAWQGWWDDATTGDAMRGKGVEVWTISGGRIARWEAAFTPTPEGQDPALALGIL